MDNDDTVVLTPEERDRVLNESEEDTTEQDENERD